MRRAGAPVLSVVLAFVLLTPAAGAKELKAVKVCGVNGCRIWNERDFRPSRKAASRGPAHIGCRLVPGATHRVGRPPHESFWVPLDRSARLVRSARMPNGSYQWMPDLPTAARVQQRAVSELEPYPASKLHLASRPEPARARPAPPPDGGDGARLTATVGLLGVLGAVGGGWYHWRRKRDGR